MATVGRRISTRATPTIERHNGEKTQNENRKTTATQEGAGRGWLAGKADRQRAAP